MVLGGSWKKLVSESRWSAVKLQILYSEELRRRKETLRSAAGLCQGGKTQGMKSQFTWDDLIEGLSE